MEAPFPPQLCQYLPVKSLAPRCPACLSLGELGGQLPVGPHWHQRESEIPAATTSPHLTPTQLTPLTPLHTTLQHFTPIHTTTHHLTPQHTTSHDFTAFTPPHTTPHHSTPTRTTSYHLTPLHTMSHPSTPITNSHHPYHLTPTQITSQYFTPPHITTHRLTLLYPTSHQLKSPHPTSYHHTSLYTTTRHHTPPHATTRHLAPLYSTSHQFTPPHTTSLHPALPPTSAPCLVNVSAGLDPLTHSGSGQWLSTRATCSVLLLPVGWGSSSSLAHSLCQGGGFPTGAGLEEGRHFLNVPMLCEAILCPLAPGSSLLGESLCPSCWCEGCARPRGRGRCRGGKKAHVPLPPRARAPPHLRPSKASTDSLSSVESHARWFQILETGHRWGSLLCDHTWLLPAAWCDGAFAWSQEPGTWFQCRGTCSIRGPPAGPELEPLTNTVCWGGGTPVVDP